MFDAMFPSHWSRIRKLYWLNKLKNNVATYEVVVGNPVSFSAKAAPLRKLQVAFSPVQSGTGDPSPDNVRPISGWDSVNVWQRGTNLFDEEWELGSIGNDGQDYPATTSVRSKSYIPVKNGATAYIGWDTAESGSVYALVYAYKADKTFSRYVKAVTVPTNLSINNDECYIRFFLYNRTTPLTDAFIHLEANLPYQPYNPSSRSISISLGQTVYGGTLDVLTGVGEVTMAKIVLDGTQAISAVNWRPIGDSVGWLYAYSETNNKVYPGLLEVPNIKSDQLKTISYNAIFSNSDATISAVSYNAEPPYAFGLAVRMTDATLTTKELINAYLHDNPITAVYELATPQTIQLTPQEVQSLLGVNNMWSNANGDLTVEYRSN